MARSISSLLVGVSLVLTASHAQVLLLTPCFDATAEFSTYFNESATTCSASAIAACQSTINATLVSEAAASCLEFNSSNAEFSSNCFSNPTCPCADLFARADLARHAAGEYFLELAACARASPSGCTAEAFEFELFANESLARDCAVTENFLKTTFSVFAPCYIFCNGPTSAPTALAPSMSPTLEAFQLRAFLGTAFAYLASMLL